MLNDLNDKQLEAVKATEGPLLVLAGAGSGKTKVLTTRIAYLIKEKNVDPYNILAITFTNKAAREMKERIINLIGSVGYSMQISTFHSFGLSIIKDNYELLGYKPNFTILDSDDTLTLIKKILKDMNIDPKLYNPKAIKNSISSAKNELIDSKKYAKYVGSDFEATVLDVYKQYESRLISNNALDFDDLLMMPIELFNNNPSVLKEYQERFKYILIDEYQDTNEAQYLLTKMLSAKYKNICVVGDDSQAIYSWRGANYRNILNFEKDYKDTKTVYLEENYRSTKTILNAANSVIKNNIDKKEKNLWTNNEEGVKITYHKALSEVDEAYYVKDEIKKLIKDGVSPSEIAVLYRTNAQSRAMEDAMLESQIPYKVIGSFYFYNRREIKDLISYLKLIYNNDDDTSLIRIINTPKRGIGLKTIENLSIKALTNKTSMFNSIDSGKELIFKNLINELKEKQENLSLTELVDLVLDKSGMKDELVKENSIEADIRLENLEEFKSITRSFEEANGIISLGEFLEQITLVSDMEEHKNNDNVVTLMTIHSAKGLEFENVFLIGMEEGIFPHKNSMDLREDLEEERRLCYVAITRAKKNLYLVNAKKRMIFGETSYNMPSRFINEIDQNCLNVDSKVEEKFDKTSMISDTIDYVVGDKVEHDTYGIGIIVSMDKSIVTIAFPHPIGIKKMIKGHKSIRKV
ncbi:MAG: UvrD-helicase domain-containing protein [Bacilli bacterium]|nr:UvrD-helicase domain-containing protein [Bacilli bacterium]